MALLRPSDSYSETNLGKSTHRALHPAGECRTPSARRSYHEPDISRHEKSTTAFSFGSRLAGGNHDHSSDANKLERPRLAVIQQPQQPAIKQVTESEGHAGAKLADGATVDVSMSSQTEPESSQWRIATQHFQSSMTEPESPQWHVKTQTSQTEPESSQWRVKTQSSSTEPESSQWRVSTQHTPSRKKNKHRAVIPTDDDEDFQSKQLSYSLPTASYDDDAQVPVSASPGSPSPEVGSSLLDLGSQYGHLLDMIEADERAGVDKDSFRRRWAHVRTSHARKYPHEVRGGGADNVDQESFISDTPLSIPSDYYDSSPSQSQI